MAKAPKATRKVKKALGGQKEQAARSAARVGKAKEHDTLKAHETNLLGDRQGVKSDSLDVGKGPFGDGKSSYVSLPEEPVGQKKATMADVPSRRASANALESAGFERTAKVGMQAVRRDAIDSEVAKEPSSYGKGEAERKASFKVDYEVDPEGRERRFDRNPFETDDNDKGTKDTALEGMGDYNERGDVTARVGKGFVKSGDAGTIGTPVDRGRHSGRSFGSRLGHFFGKKSNPNGPAAGRNNSGWSDEAIDAENADIGAAVQRSTIGGATPPSRPGARPTAMEVAGKSARTPEERSRKTSGNFNEFLD